MTIANEPHTARFDHTRPSSTKYDFFAWAVIPQIRFSMPVISR